MDRPYDDIPSRAGTHRGPGVDEEPTTSVRAPKAAYPPEEEPKPPAPAFRLYYNEREGVHRVHSWHTEPIDVTDEGYQEIGQFAHSEAGELMKRLPDRPRFYVLEDPETGDVLVEPEGDVTNWLEDGRYSQISIFGDENAAAAYADRLRNR